jgi:transposase-like protein
LKNFCELCAFSRNGLDAGIGYTSGEFRGKDGWLKGPVEAGISFCYINSTQTEDTRIVRVPRERNGEFEPQLIAKHQRRWDGFDETILALYARGMTIRDIQSFLREKYDIDVSPWFISSVCESLSAGVQEWRTRPLQAVWPILYLDALFLKVRDG